MSEILLKSRNSEDIRKALWGAVINSIENPRLQQALGEFSNILRREYSIDPAVAKAPDEVQGARERPRSHFKVLEARIRKIIENYQLDRDEKVKLMECASLLFQMMRSASLKSAYNSHAHEIVIGKAIDDISQDLVYDLNAIISHLNAVTVDRVITGHPTYSGTTEYAQEMMLLNRAIAEDDYKRVKASIEKLTQPSFIAAAQKPLNTAQECQQGLHYIGQTFDYLPNLYAVYDKNLSDRFGNDYDPLSLKLNIKTQSWISSGDKDGNTAIDSNSLRDSIHQHRVAASKFYTNKVRDIFGEETADIITRLEELKTLDPDQNNYIKIESLRAEITDLFRNEYVKNKQIDPIKAKKALDAYRQIEASGLSFGSIEFRETSYELEKVIGKFVKAGDINSIIGKTAAYHELNEDERNAVLDAYINNPGLAQNMIEAELANVREEAKAPGYKYADSKTASDDCGAIFYHTIQRLKLAKANPDMFAGQQVLAEAENARQTKEMIMLLKALGMEKQILVVMLFEDPQILLDSPKILEALLKDKVCFKYLVDISLHRARAKFGDEFNKIVPDDLLQRIAQLDPAQEQEYYAEVGKINDDIKANTGGKYEIRSVLQLQSQTAHSDNTRRGGAIAGRGFIGNSNRQCAEMCDKFGFGYIPYQGGSETDPQRKGRRSFRAVMNGLDSQFSRGFEYVKATVQGIDNFMLNNGPLEWLSYIGEIFTHAAKQADRFVGGKYKTARQREAANYQVQARDIQNVISSCHAAWQAHGNAHFSNPRLREVIEQVLNYSVCVKSGGVTTRTPSRTASTGPSLSRDVDNVRTIGYSETFLHNQVNISFVGAEEFREKLIAGITQDKAVADITESASLNNLYKSSPLTKDITDRIADAVASTDFDKLWDEIVSTSIRNGGIKHVNSDGKVIGSEKISSRPSFSKLKELAERSAETTIGYFAKLELMYRAGARLAIETLTGQPSKLPENCSCEALRYRVNVLTGSARLTQAEDAIIALTRVIEKELPEGDEIGLRSAHNTRDYAIMRRPESQFESLTAQLNRAA